MRWTRVFWCIRLWYRSLLAFALSGLGTGIVAKEAVNVAAATQKAVAIADSEFGRFSADQVIDGTIVGPQQPPEVNRWHSALTQPHPHWVWIRFRERARIQKVVIHPADLKGHPVDFIGEYSPDGGATFFPLFSVTNCPMGSRAFAMEHSFPPRVTDNFRLRILRSADAKAPDVAQVSEIQVFGEFLGPLPPQNGQHPGADDRLPLSTSVLRPTSLEGLQITQAAEQVEFRSPWLRIAFSTKTPIITALCWDSLGEGKVGPNLLKPTPDGGVQLRHKSLFPEEPAEPSGRFERDQNVIRYSERLAGGAFVRWEIRVEPKGLRVALSRWFGRPGATRELPGMRFAFCPTVTPVSPLANPRPGVPAPMPLLLHAADFGTLLARTTDQSPELGLTAEPGLRSLVQWQAQIHETAAPRGSDGLFVVSTNTILTTFELSVEECAPLKTLIRNEPRLRGLSRSWLNTFQYRPERGILSNNPLSDNAVQSLFTYTDPAVFTPVLPGAVEVINLARESLERYFAGAPGYGVGQEDVQPDAYPALLIAAWDVIQVTGDKELLRRWLPTLEAIAAKAMAQDRNGNGLPESTRSGLPGAFKGVAGNWWDEINFGHEDAYVCALSFRAFNGLAELEQIACRPEQAVRFHQQAGRIAAAYVPTFLNPKTGVIAGWKDAQGELHDYWFPFINGMAITYGLVPEKLAKSILDRFQAKFKEVGYTRFDLGLPGNLVPIGKGDYSQASFGSPQKEDGTDSFGCYQNGGATACYAYFYIQALYQMGRRAEAGAILWPMMESFAQGRFQNGVGHGGDWRRWDGTPCGYEGFLADGYYTQMAVFTGHYGIGFGPVGFHLESWSPWKGQAVPLGLKYMGKVVDAAQ